MTYQTLFTLMVLFLNAFCAVVFFYSSRWAWKHNDSRPWAIILFIFGCIFVLTCISAINGDITWR